MFAVVSMLRFLFFVMFTVHSRLVGSFAQLFAALALFIVPAVRGSLIFGVYVDFISGISRGDFWVIYWISRRVDGCFFAKLTHGNYFWGSCREYLGG